MSKHTVKLLLAFVAGWIVSDSWAQAYKDVTDVIYGQNCFVQANDQWIANGDKKSTDSYSWPQRSDAEVCYYLRVPAGYAKMTATFTTTTSAAFRLTITDPETKQQIYSNEATTSGSGVKSVQLLPGYRFAVDKWYRFAISTQQPSAISNIVKLEFNRESEEAVVASAVFGAPSAHLWSTAPIDPMAPKGSNYDWAYEEVMYPSKYIRPATYVEAIATLGGYMGIQTGGIVLFSMWDDGDTDKDPYLPDYLKSTCMDSHPDIRIKRFGGEGTGVQSMFQNQEKHTWKPDTWVQFLFNARPEEVIVTVKGSKGQDSTFIRNNTITTAWYKNADDSDWTYMATLRKSGNSSLITGWYSFLEDFAENGCDFTRAYYRNGYMRSAQSGKWYNVSHYTYGHTDGPQNGRKGRSDYGHGVTSEFENTFFMEHGGFFTKEHDSLAYAGIPRDQSCVDTIDIEAKTERINQAIQKQARAEAALKLQQNGETYDLRTWEVIGFSDQSEEGDGDNGRAAQAVDGNADTYWRNKWKNGGILYPHWISLKAPNEVTISEINLTSGSSYLYWPKHIKIYTSSNGEDWQSASEELLIAKEASSNIILPKRVSAQYFKLEFTDSYGAALNIKEIGLKTDISTAKIMDYAKDLVENAGCFDHFTIEQTEPLKEICSASNPDVDEINKAVNELITNGTMLRYGNINSASYVSSLKIYQLSNAKGLGKLICTPDCKLSIGQATTQDALQQFKPKVDVTRPENNWMMIRVEGYNTSYIYNPGLQKYLDVNAENYLSDTPAALSLTYNAAAKAFVVRCDSKYLCLDPASATEPIKFLSSTLSDGSYFELLDNFYLTPNQADVQPVLDECTDLAKFPTMVKKLGEILDVEQGLVGSVPEGEERNYLVDLYNAGNISIDKRLKLYKALDECERTPFDPSKYVYRIKSTTENNTEAPYLTLASASATNFAAQSQNNVAQIWTFNANGEGLAPTSQNISLGRLPSEANIGIGLAKANTATMGKYYITESSPGNFKLSTTQNGGIAYSANTPGKSIAYESEDAVYQLEIAQTINVSMQSSGLKGVCYGFDIIIPEDLEVYIVDHIDNGTAYLLRVYDRLPAGEPAIIKGQSYQNITLNIAAPTESNIAGNMLHGTYLSENGIKGTLYTLKTTDGGIFAKAATSNVSANSVYLVFDAADAPTGKLTLNFSDEPCAIQETQSTLRNNQRYNLQGHPIAAPRKGEIYIQDGKIIKQQ